MKSKTVLNKIILSLVAQFGTISMMELENYLFAGDYDAVQLSGEIFEMDNLIQIDENENISLTGAGETIASLS